VRTAVVEDDLRTHLLFPVLHAFLALRVSLFAVETKEPDEGPKHALFGVDSVCGG